ncbi:methyltransferase FkbM [Helicobacter muridarum]|uniref:Methyltransferase n=1 Tax=Helicobacter muridarum TaxID=216 RepID=A0A099TWQ0_9HELI|nr:hypothetical protein [Helicobacter muridarum]TLE00226.1 methyltransferase FkbM [Helicobacter muridarum]STQ85715.1 methyltransferase [Helicobacter muridarum]
MNEVSKKGYQCKSPILFLTFNRLDTVKQTLPQILKTNPSRIYLASDGARVGKKDSNNELESDKVARVREYMLHTINNQCEVKTRFLDSNHGCKMGVSSAISWFFDNEEQGIIIEDDCLPNLSFFRFCDELLETYKEMKNILLIAGWSGLDILPKTKHRMKEDYFFSKYAHIWGWASWANRWARYEREIKDFELYFQKMRFCNHRERKYWYRIFSKYIANEIDTWDYPLTYTSWKYNMISIQPKNSMIRNIGFNRDDATHTKDESIFATLPNYELKFPLVAPSQISVDEKIDKAIFEGVFNGRQQYVLRLINKIATKFIGKKIFWH